MKTVSFAVLATFCASFCIAQDKQDKQEKPAIFPLQKVERSAMPGETRCGSFFVSTTFGGTVTAPEVIYIYKAADGKFQHETIPISRTVVHIREGVASYEKSYRESDQRTTATFWLSDADYALAKSCVSPSTPAPPPTTPAKP